MARGFNTTLGAGTSDRIKCQTYVSPTSFSSAGWFWRRGATGTGTDAIWDKTGTAVTEQQLSFRQTSTAWRVTAKFSTTAGAWSVTDAASLVTGAWVHIVVTYDGSSTANNPVVYINGKSVTVTVLTAPVGTISLNSGEMTFGNRSSSGNAFDGILGDIAWWNNKILTAAEAVALYQGADPRTIQRPYLFDNIIVSEGEPYSPIWATQPTAIGTKPRADRLVITQGRTFPFAQVPAANQVINPSKGALVISGKTPTVKLDQFIAPSKAAIVIGGKTPTVTVNTIIAPAKGAVVITGKTPSVDVSQFIAPSKGHVQITGYTPVVDQPTSQVVNPSKGAVRLTGYVPTVTVSGQAGGDTHDGATIKRHAELRKKRQRQVDALLETKLAEADEIAATIRAELAPKAPMPRKSATSATSATLPIITPETHDYEQEDEEIMALLFA